MSDGQTLFLVISLLYLSDCLIWIGKRTIVFSSTWRGRWRISLANDSLGNANGSLSLLHPLLPCGMNFLGHWMTVSLSPAGICDFSVQSYPDARRSFQTGKVLVYEEISEVSADGIYLVVNNTRFSRCNNTEQAKLLAALISRIITESLEKRAELIREFIEGQFATDEARSRLSQVTESITGMRWLCTAFFLMLYVVVPIMVSLYGLYHLVIPVALFMFISAGCIAVLFSRAHKNLYPSHTFDRMSSILKMILCPPAAMRAVDAVTRNAMTKFHPLLLADLLHGSETKAFTRTFIRDLTYPIRHELTDQRALPIVSWHTDCELQACTHFLETQTATTMNELLAPPPWDGVSSAYCPHCLCQFGAVLDECPDCPGVQLMPVSATTTSPRGDR